MLRLKNIVKNYYMGDTTVEALRGIDLDFRDSEFVSILGPSGCGKTTLLNIIGGLDRYTDGDLMINGISTKEYKDGNWDVYRNKSIGFVFQSYNLIQHQTVLSNVELALTLAGTSKEERRKRATDALEEVGLSDQLNKKPNQLSGGQMQRVAIARALVNNPRILLADEPTGALDTTTSTQIMELLKEVAKDRIVIMVTHNSDIAEAYSSRIVQLLDGKIISDSNPYNIVEEAKQVMKKKEKKQSLSFLTALSLSYKNLLTKKTRTLLTAFAGSIGIIGIALILSLSNGMNLYIDDLVSETLSAYPIEIESQSIDMSGIMSSMMATNNTDGVDHDLDDIYSNNITTDMMSTVSMQIFSNDLTHFRRYIESSDGEGFKSLTNSIKYGYDLELQVFNTDLTQGIVQINPSSVYAELNAAASESGLSRSGPPGSGGGSGSEVWGELLDNDEILSSQYDILAGGLPSNFDEIVVIVDQNNEISDMALYSLGLLDRSEFDALTEQLKNGDTIKKGDSVKLSYEELLSTTYKLVLQTDYYQKEEGVWVDKSDDVLYMASLLDNAIELKVVGVLRLGENMSELGSSANMGYTPELTEYVIDGINQSEIAMEQVSNKRINVFTGESFDNRNSLFGLDSLQDMLGSIPEEQQDMISGMLENMSEEDLMSFMSAQLGTTSDEDISYETNLSTLGIVDLDHPTSIKLYPYDLGAKDDLIDLLAVYNKEQTDAGNDSYVINYTDLVGIMTSSISTMIDIISYVLIAFVAISLVVSSIMIAIITYISVLERTKEIGILRSIGASKTDISRVFNAETIIEGLVAGTLGVLIAVLLSFPINAIIDSVASVENIANLAFQHGLLLILLSVFLTVFAGLIPSKMAAKKDPVEALRSE